MLRTIRRNQMAPAKTRTGDRQMTWHTRKASRRGGAALELCVVLALLLTVVLGGMTLLGLATRDVFREFSLASATERPDSGQAGRDQDRPGEKPRNSFGAVARETIIRTWQPLAIGVTVLLNLLLWYLMYRRHCRTLHEQSLLGDEPEEPPDFEKSLFCKRQQLLATLTTHLDAVFDGRLTVAQFMTRDVIRVEPHATWQEVAELVAAQRTRHVFVCDAKKRLLGVIHSDSVGGASRDARQMMRACAATADPDTPFAHAITLLIRNRQNYLPVARDGRLCGVLTMTDLSMALQAILVVLHRLAPRVKPLLDDRRGTTISEVLARQNAELDGNGEPEPSIVSLSTG